MKRLLTTFAFALATLCISACDSRRQPLFTANPLGAGTGPAHRVRRADPRRRIRGFTTHSRPTGLPKERPCCASRWPGSRSWRRGRTATKSNRSKFSEPGVGSTDGIAPGTDVKHLFENGGISQTDNDGRLVITLNGMTYRVSGLGKEGREKLGKAHAGGVTPRISAQDFNPGAKVTSILIN